MSQGIVPLEEAYLQGIFDQLAKLEIQLDADPLIYGPKRLNQKVALARKMLTECERMFLDVAQKHSLYKRNQRAAQLVLDLAMKNLLANDPEVRAGRAVSEREAIATGKLKVEVREVADSTQAIEDLDAVLTVIKAKRSDLRDLQGRLRDQIRLCQEEVGLGGRWGSKHPRGVELQPGQGFATGDDVAAIDAVIQTARTVSDAELHLKAEVDTSDDTLEAEAALLAGLDGGDDEAGEVDDLPTPEPPKPPSKLDFQIPGEDLVKEFGFVPHCEVCGEVQFKCWGGMSCSNGHGGAASVPPPEDVLADAPEPSQAVLHGTSDQEEVSSFLSLVAPTPPASGKKSRYQVEEEEGMDLASILDNFNKG